MADKFDILISRPDREQQPSSEETIRYSKPVDFSKFTSETSENFEMHYSKIEKRFDALSNQIATINTSKNEAKSDMNNQEDITSLHQEIRRLSESLSLIKLEIDRRESCTEDRLGKQWCNSCSLF